MLRHVDHSLVPTGAAPLLLEEPPIEQLRRALAIPANLITGIGAHQWNNPTPCARWSVRDLVGHLIEGHHLVAALLGGAHPPLPRPAPARHSADPHEAFARGYRDASDNLLAAFSHDDALHRLAHIPLGGAIPTRSKPSTTVEAVVIGPVTGAVALHLRIVEALMHGWDLAQATGQNAQFPEELTEQALGFIIGRLITQPDAKAVFEPSQTAPAYAPAINRLAACLGRNPHPSTHTG